MSQAPNLHFAMQLLISNEKTAGYKPISLEGKVIKMWFCDRVRRIVGILSLQFYLTFDCCLKNQINSKYDMFFLIFTVEENFPKT